MRSCGFDVLDVTSDYEGQYLMIEARPAAGSHAALGTSEHELDQLAADVLYFADGHRTVLETWRARLSELRHRDRRTVIWGAGSKGVAFLTALDVQEEVQYAVDVNPYKRGTYMAGTGHEIVAPDFLREWRPDVVIAMNPIYGAEIDQQLAGMGLHPELITV
jgi:hypothetical protein